MKRLLVTSSLLLSGFAFADIDYSRCMYSSGLSFQGVNITNDGQIEPMDHMTLKGALSNGKIEHYTFGMKEKSPFMGGMASEVNITVERDDQGRIIRIGTGGEKPDQKTIDMWKKSYSNPYAGGWMSNKEPVFNIDGKKVPLEKVTKDQAKEAGFANNLDEFRKLKSAHRKDKKTLQKMKEAYKKVHEKADYVIPFGTETEFDFKDGVCMTKSVSSKTYSTKTRDVSRQLVSSREGCEEVQKLYKKYETKLNECKEVQTSLDKEFYENFTKKKANIFPSDYPMGGYAGGIAGGMVGGYTGGGMYGGYMNSGMQFGPIHTELATCEYTYGVGKIGFGTVGGYGSGSKEESKASKQ